MLNEFWIIYFFKSCSNSLKLEKNREQSKNDFPVSLTPAICDFPVSWTPFICNFPVSGTQEICDYPVSQLKASWLEV